MGQGIYWVLRVPGFGYVKEEQFTGKFEYVANYKEATSFGRDTAIKMRSTRYIGAKIVKITQNGQKKSPLGRASAPALQKRRGFAAPPAPVATPKRITHVGICVDASGSMQGWESETQNAVNSILDSVRAAEGKDGVTSDVSLWTFGIASGRPAVFANASTPWRNHNGVPGILNHEVREDYVAIPATSVQNLTGYRTSGWTPLNDAVGNAIERLMSIQHNAGEDVAYLLEVVSDGNENTSTKFTTQLVKEAIAARQATDRWTFAFLVPPGTRDAFVRLYGVPAGNVKEWERSARGFQEIKMASVASNVAYFGSRAVGATRSLEFYETDLSKVDVSDLARKLTDVTSRVKASKVEKEVAIRDFIEAKGEVYRKGDAFFPLTKTETVDSDKKIIVQDRKTGRYYSGAQVRKVLGIPAKSARVSPGNHAYFNLLIQSTSDNRKLVRGTELLYVKPGETIPQ